MVDEYIDVKKYIDKYLSIRYMSTFYNLQY